MKNKIIVYFFCLFLVSCILEFPVYAAPPGNATDWELTFSDEFEEASLDRTKWNTRYSFGDQTLNDELQAFTDDSLITTGDGFLKIRANNANPQLYFDGEYKAYKAGVVTTAEKFFQKYGYFEMRAKFPSCSSCWPGFWMLAQTEAGTNEIDVVEQWSDNAGKFFTATFQGPNADYSGAITHQFTNSFGNLSSYHTIGVDWQQNKISWYLDGVKLANDVTTDIPQVPMYPIVSFQIGGPGRCNPGDCGTPSFPQDMSVDYVKVYRKKDGKVNTPTIFPIGRIFVAPTQVTLSDSTENAQIYYTTNGAEPTQNSTLYTGPFILNSSVTLKAKAFATGLIDSGTVTADFNIFPQATNATGWNLVNISDSLRTAPITGFAKQVGQNTFIVGGAGFGIRGKSDSVAFLYQEMPANGEISAKVSAMDYFTPKTKIGLMIRQNLTPTSLGNAMLVSPLLGSVSVYRSSGDGNIYPLVPDEYSPQNSDTAPIFLRLVRSGSLVQMFKKKTATESWIDMGSMGIGATGKVYAGFVVSSRYFDMLNTVLFENVTTQGTSSPVPPAVVGISDLRSLLSGFVNVYAYNGIVSSYGK